MNKLIKIINNNLKVIVAFILGILITSTIGVVAYTINANDVSFTPSNKNWKVTNVKEAVDELYSKSSKDIPSGLAFLYTIKGDGLRIEHSISTYSAYAYLYNLNFSGIKKFKIEYSLSTTNPQYQELSFRSIKTGFDYTINGSVSNSEVNVNGATDINFSLVVSLYNTGVLKAISYTTYDDVEHML